jgi:putative ABC transport system substrate-binding protein
MLMTSGTARRVLLGQLLASLAASPIALASRRAAPAWAGSPGGHLQKGEVRTPSEALLTGALRVKGWSEPGNLVPRVARPLADKTLAMAAAEFGDASAGGPRVGGHAGDPGPARPGPAKSRSSWSAPANPVGTGLVASLARPGGNVTGGVVAARRSDSQDLEPADEMVPRARRVGLVNQAGDPGQARFEKVMADAARPARGLGWQGLQVRTSRMLVAAISDSRADALLLIANQMIYRRPERIAEAGRWRARLPIAVTGAPARDPVRGRHPVLLHPREQELYRPRRGVHRPHPARRETRRHSGRAASALRLHHQTSGRRGAMDLEVPRALPPRRDELIE